MVELAGMTVPSTRLGVAKAADYVMREPTVQVPPQCDVSVKTVLVTKEKLLAESLMKSMDVESLLRAASARLRL